MLRLITVHRTERVAIVRDGRFTRLLGPGRHLVWTLGLTELLRLDVSTAITRAADADALPDELDGASLFAVAGHERVVVERQGEVAAVLGAGRYRLWDGVADLTLRRIDVRAEPVALPDGDRMVGQVLGAFVEQVASARQAVVLFRDGQPVRALPVGRYRAWTGGPWALVPVALALQPVELALQDLVTGDQVPVRVKAAATLRVTDPVARLVEPNAADLAYAAVHLALRDLVSGRSFDALLAEREGLSDVLVARARARLPAVGLELVEAHVKDVILPAEVRELVNRVTFARKEAEALAIKRREEVAATRQLANTARLLESSPVLLRLKELEALGEAVRRIDKLVVVGGAGELSRQFALRAIDTE